MAEARAAVKPLISELQQIYAGLATHQAESASRAVRRTSAGRTAPGRVEPAPTTT
ncbi:hypothetical protein ACIQSP_16150 [Streptomyces nigra]|uniref:hypothetical protein n=1 Tax=Streptomyces nigra TaxID=1827580 RepID=UPI0037F25E94